MARLRGTPISRHDASHGGELASELAAFNPDALILYMSAYPDNPITEHGVIASSIPFPPQLSTPGTLAQKVREVLEGLSSVAGEASASYSGALARDRMLAPTWGVDDVLDRS
jgi:hypothetical protein